MNSTLTASPFVGSRLAVQSTASGVFEIHPKNLMSSARSDSNLHRTQLLLLFGFWTSFQAKSKRMLELPWPSSGDLGSPVESRPSKNPKRDSL